MAIKLISWNVNGIRSVLKKGFLDFVKTERPDVLCLQETKGTREQAGVELAGYEDFWSTPPQRPGYSGTAVFTRIKSQAVRYGMGAAEHDREGRLITLDLGDLFLVNVYVPNSKRELERLPYRQEWDADLLKYLKGLEKKKPVVLCGDMNVAHQEIDLTYPKQNEHSHGFTAEERAGFDKLVRAGFIDTFREFHENGGHYTWWSQFNDCRKRNIGWRIDYFCVSKGLRPRLKEAFILPEVMGSDHCPVGLVLK